MLARCTTYLLDGLTAHPVTVECDIRPGLPSFTVLGVSDAAARELRETVRAAVLNCGYRLPERRVTLNIAPSWLRCASASLPLAAAVAVLAAAGEIPANWTTEIAVYGALTPGGEISPLPGTLAAAAAHRSTGCAGPLLHAGPPLAPGLAAAGSVPVCHLGQILGPASSATLATQPPDPLPVKWPTDFGDIRGHEEAIFALTVAAAGGHHVLLRGAPGSGATMLARRLVTILPELTPEQEREVATIRDAAGLGPARGHPFRAPHHTISAAGLVGGGSPVRPGEVTLAHRGVLFLSDLPEFSRSTLEALHAPLDDESVVIARGERVCRFPSSFQLVAAAPPCPCELGGTPRCACDFETLARYQRRLSGSLLDRFAIVIDLCPDVDTHAAPAPSSAELRERIRAARERRSLAARLNGGESHGPTAEGREPVLSDTAWAALHDAYRVGSMTHRSGALVLAVAQTVADLAGEDLVTVESLNTARALGGRQATPAPKFAC